MNYIKFQKACQEAVLRFGSEPQLRQLQEECSELSVAISHYIRQREGAMDEIVEELADVVICIYQALLILQCFDEFYDTIDRKLDRLTDKLEGHSK